MLLTLHMEVRSQIIYSLTVALSPKSAPYLLEQEVKEPDPRILSLNLTLSHYDETSVQYLREKEIAFIRTGLAQLMDSFLVTNAGMVNAMNSFGCGRMKLNILVLQQNLKNIESEVSLSRSAKFYEMFGEGPEAILKGVKEEKERGEGGMFGYEELKTLVELCYSEQLGDRERGISGVARRRMDEDLLQLNEYMWQS